MSDYEASKRVARDDLIKKVLQNKTKLSLAQVKKLQKFQQLLDEDINEIYRDY